MKYLSKMLVTFFLFLISTACGPEKLKGLKTINPLLTEEGKVDVEYCALDPETISDKLRAVFAIDWTGSNEVASCPGQGCPTDPGGTIRIPPLLRYISNRRSLPNFNSENEGYAFFQWSSTVDLWNGGATSDVGDNGRFVPLDEFETIVTNQQGVAEAGGTPYIGTITKIREKLRAEAEAEKKKFEEDQDPFKTIECFDAVAIFVSDGFPDPPEDVDEITSAVEDLLDLETDPQIGPFICSITVNTAFYNSVPLQDAIDRLKAMAEAGRGKFFNFLGADEIDYNQVTQTQVRQVVTETIDYFLVNENISWSLEDKKYVPDLDADGLPDNKELDHCHPSANEFLNVKEWDQFFDCDQNDVRDGIEYWLSFNPKQQCKSENCDPEEARKLQCRNPDGTMEDQDGDGIIDCEERLLDSTPTKFDSTLDGIPDPIKLRHFYNMVPSAVSGVPIDPASNRDSDGDGISDYNEIRTYTPWNYHNDLAEKGFKPLKYNPLETFVDQETGLTCNRVSILDVPLATSNDNICIYIIDKELTGVGRRFLRKGCKRLEGRYNIFFRDDYELKTAK